MRRSPRCFSLVRRYNATAGMLKDSPVRRQSATGRNQERLVKLLTLVRLIHIGRHDRDQVLIDDNRDVSACD